MSKSQLNSKTAKQYGQLPREAKVTPFYLYIGSVSFLPHDVMRYDISLICSTVRRSC